MVNSVSMVNNGSEVLEARLPNSWFSCKPDEIKRMLNFNSSNSFIPLIQNIRAFNIKFDELLSILMIIRKILI